MYEEYKGKLDDIASTKRNVALIEKVKEFGELLDKFRVKVINIVKNDNKEKVFFSGKNVSIFYDLADKLNKAMHYPYYIEYGAKVNSFIRVMDAYIKLLSDIQNPEKIEEEYAKRMDKRTAESTGEPKLTYRLLKEYNKLLQEEKLSALPKKIKEAEIEKILKTFSLNNPNWLEESLKNKIAEDYGGLSVLEPIITDQYGQWNDFLRLPDETMDNLKAQLNEKAKEYFYLPVITKHWVNILTSQYWVNSYNYKVVIAKKPALEKALNYTYRNIVEGNDDVLFLWEFTLRPENEPPTIILEQQGLYKGLRGQGFISEAYPLFVQCLAEKFPGWQVEGEFENPAALALFKNNFLEPRPLNSIKGEEPDNAKSVIWNARIPPFNLSSSSVDNPGGIDLTALPITAQSVLNKPLAENMSVAGSGLSFTIDLDNELRQIQDMLKAGIMPASERIKEYALASSSLKPEDYSREIDRLLGCIADVFRLEEEKAKPTPQALKDALILLESDSSA